MHKNSAEKPSPSFSFERVSSIGSLLAAWHKFVRGKSSRRDVLEYWRDLEVNLFSLSRELQQNRYRHAPYESFYVHDPKRRHIRKACVRDRIVQQAVSTELESLYEPTLIHDLYSGRAGKGVHAGVRRMRVMLNITSKNLSGPCWALKCDIRRFYDSVDHIILLGLLHRNVQCSRARNLLAILVHSFHVENQLGKGLPIGNVTSQIFTNIYLNGFDHFVKQRLRVRCYARFSDDFIVLSANRNQLEEYRVKIEEYLNEKLILRLHPAKVSIRELRHGIDFLGTVILPRHTVLRRSTRLRMLRKLRLKQNSLERGGISEENLRQSLNSYLGMLSHHHARTLQELLINRYGIPLLRA